MGGVSSRPSPTHSRFLEFQKYGLFQNRGKVKWREFQTSPWNWLFSGSWVDLKESYRLKNPRGYRFPKIWTIFKLGVSFLSKNNPDFFNSKIQNYFKTAGIQVEGVSNLSVKLSVERELSHFGGELQSEKIPAVIKFQNSWLFQNRGNFNLAGFQSKMKLPILGKFSRLNREFHPKFYPYFWNSRIQEYFKTAGILKREFQTSRWNCLYSGSWVTLKESYSLKKSPRLFYSKNLDYFRIAGILIWRGFRVKWNSRFLENFQGYTGSFIQNFTFIFGIPEIGTISEPREY